MERETEWQDLIVGFYEGLDGFFYVVFRDTDFAWDYAETNGGRLASFGNFENAVGINETLGM